MAEVLYEHPAVAEAGVIDVGHDLLNEEGGAVIVRKRGATATASEISGLVKKRIAAYKYPRQVWFVDELPKDTTGKILRGMHWTTQWLSRTTVQTSSQSLTTSVGQTGPNVFDPCGIRYSP